jgi:hypothetical protein
MIYDLLLKREIEDEYCLINNANQQLKTSSDS